MPIGFPLSNLLELGERAMDTEHESQHDQRYRRRDPPKAGCHEYEAGKLF
jgi:hypothetical protein